MTTGNLVEGWDEDMSISDPAEFEDNGNNHDFRRDHSQEPEKCSDENFVTDYCNVKDYNSGIDFTYIHDQDMNYYQETNSYYHSSNYGLDDEIIGFNSRSMLGHINEPSSIRSNENDYDPDYDMEVNKLLQEEEDFLLNGDSSQATLKNEKSQTSNDDFSDPVKDQYEDYYDEFLQDNEVDEAPQWYEKMIQKKVKETKLRLEDLSTLVCYASSSTREQIRRIELDHNTPFCKLDYPRHPPLSKPWNNYWRFNCSVKCRVDPPEPEHAHTLDCEILLLEHVSTGVSTRSKNILPSEFPEYVMRTVELFQEFATITSKDTSYLEDEGIPDTVYERPIWSYIKIRSNYKNEIMLIACGKGVSPLLKPLKRYFNSGPGRSCNVVSLYCINIKWSQKKSQFPPSFITGCLELRDKVGPISINYNPRTNINFNSIESQQLGKIVLEYLSPTAETTIIDLGCNFGVLSLMMSQKCDRVIGLNTLDYEIKMAEEIKEFNNLHNASFIVCNPKEVHTKCSSLLKKCIAVAILNLASPFGKSPDVMKALRNLPSVWRVAVYGSFTKEFHKHITVLTSKDEQMGDEFLPMQGCILDKSPTVANAFDIIILFERKSLIEPSIELIAAGPTVNVKKDVNESWAPNGEVKAEKKFSLKVEKGFGDQTDNRVKNPAYRPFLKFGRPSKKYGRFDSPLLPKESDPKPEISSTSKQVINEFDRPYVPKPREKRFDCPSIAKDLKIKDLKRIFDCPSLPKSKEKSVNSPPKSQDNEFASPSLLTSTENKIDCSSLTKFRENEFDSSSLLKSNEKQFDCPALINEEKQFDYPLSAKKEDYSSLVKKENEFDCPPVPRSAEIQFDSPSLVKKENQFDCPPLSRSAELQFDSPSLVKKENQLDCPPLHRSLEIQLDSPSIIKQETQSNCSPLPRSNKKQLDGSLFVKQKIRFDNSPPVRYNERQVNCPSLTKQERKFNSPPLPRSVDMQQNCPSLIKQESQSNCPPAYGVDNKSTCQPLPPLKVEPSGSFSDKEEGELSPDSTEAEQEEDNLSNVIIKSEPMDLDNDDEAQIHEVNMVNDALIKCEAISSDSSQPSYLDVNIKTEPIDSPETLTPVTPELTTSIKREPMNMKISPISDLDEFENMVTPVHNPVAFTTRATPSPPPTSTNFKTIDGFEFSVKPNQSFLSYKLEPPDQQEQKKVKPQQEQERQSSPQPSVKREKPTEPSSEAKTNDKGKSSTDDDEISIISVKKEKKDKDVTVKKERRESKDNNVKSKDEIKKEMSKEDKEQADLRKLIEKRKNIQKQLDRDREYRQLKHRFDRSPSATGRRYRSPTSPTPPDRRYRSPSPPMYRSPISPDRLWDKRCRSPLSPSNRRYRKSPPPSPSDRRYRKSPPLSPSDRRYRKSSPLSPSDRRYRKSPPLAYRRSPSPSADRRYRYNWKSKSAFDKKRDKSPVVRKRRSRSRSDLNSKSRQRSMSISISRSRSRSRSRLRSKSPVTIPPTTPRRLSNSTSNKPNKSSKTTKSSKSIKKKKKRPSVDSVEPATEMTNNSKCDDQWDIPNLSALSDDIVEELKVVEKEKVASPATSPNSSNVSTVQKQEVS